MIEKFKRNEGRLRSERVLFRVSSHLKAQCDRLQPWIELVTKDLQPHAGPLDHQALIIGYCKGAQHWARAPNVTRLKLKRDI